MDLESLNKEWADIKSKENSIKEEKCKLDHQLYELRQKSKELYDKGYFAGFTLYVGLWVKPEDVRKNKLLEISREEFEDLRHLFRMSDEDLENSHLNPISIEFIRELKNAKNDNRMQRILFKEIEEAGNFFFPYIDTPNGRVYIKR